VSKFRQSYSGPRGVVSDEFRAGWNAGYQQALLDALRERDGGSGLHKKIGGPDSPYKPRGVPGSIYND
jgi:hypothetical protein